MEGTIEFIVLFIIMFFAGYSYARSIWKGNWQDISKLYKNSIKRLSELEAKGYQKDIELDKLKEEYFRRGFIAGGKIDIFDEIIAEIIKRESKANTG